MAGTTGLGGGSGGLGGWYGRSEDHLGFSTASAASVHLQHKSVQCDSCKSGLSLLPGVLCPGPAHHPDCEAQHAD